MSKDKVKSDLDGADYEVGFGKPPAQHHFKPGRSGNPTGRPKGRRNAAATIHRIMNERVSVLIGNKTVLMSAFEAMFYSLRNQALKGNPKAIREMIAITAEHDSKINPPEDMRITFVRAKDVKRKP